MVWSDDRPCELLVPVPPGGLTIGRELLAQLGHNTTDDRISRRHAHVTSVDGGFAIVDLRSRNGTFAAGKAVAEQEQLVAAPCVIRTGRTVSVVMASLPVAPKEPARAEGNAFSVDTTRVDDSRAYGLAYNADGTGVDSRTIARGLPVERDAAVVAAKRSDNLFILGEPGTGTRAIGDCYAGARDTLEMRIDGGAWGAPYPLPNGAVTLHLSNPLALPVAAQHALLTQLSRRTDLRVVTRSHTPIAGVEGFSPILAARLSAAVIRVPPLRERPAALVSFVTEVVRAAAPGLPVHATLIETCLLRPWPGNFREVREQLTSLATDLADDGKRAFRGEDLPLSIGYEQSSAMITIGGASMQQLEQTDLRRRRDSTKPDID